MLGFLYSDKPLFEANSFIKIRTVVRSRQQQMESVFASITNWSGIDRCRDFRVQLHLFCLCLFFRPKQSLQRRLMPQEAKEGTSHFSHCSYLQNDFSRKNPRLDCVRRIFFRFFKLFKAQCQRLCVAVRATRCSPVIILFQRDKLPV